ncbi:hypothetical protein Sste5346_000348 [Sporothrix stenoceras]|uniref:Uncharacterized protein n=1 Tax=Sporothrix stenoceras TaxID=5173 RepID=A0ABR3ZUN9_9PEZI
MCFIEFVGYTCGHTSMPVLRPCPLTTASHTFPACSRRGDKTFFAGEMCSACQKIVHSRATQIEEYEHRFMHERGVCGCETVFPYLIRPRVIGSCGGGVDEPGVTKCDAQGHEHGGQGGQARQARHGTDIWTVAKKADNNIKPTEIQLPPLLCEATDPGGHTTVSVRLPSLYAAEWVADHRGRHEASLCHCPVDFRTYEEVVGQGSATAAKPEAGVATGESNVGPSRPLRRSASMSAMSSSSDSGEPGVPERQITRSSSHDGLTYFVAVAGEPPNDDKEGTVTAESALDNKQVAPVAQDGGFAVTHAPIQLHPGKSVRYAGSVFAEVPEYLQLMGPFLSQPAMQAQGGDQTVMLDCVLDDNGGNLTLASGGGHEHDRVDYIGRPEHFQNQPGIPTTFIPPSAAHTPRPSRRRPRAHTMADMKEHYEHQAQQRIPLVGFPIGAGPEGVSHAIPWRNRPPCWRRS